MSSRIAALLSVLALPTVFAAAPAEESIPSLREIYADRFDFGTAVHTPTSSKLCRSGA